jgi:hypothetical protein
VAGRPALITSDTVARETPIARGTPVARETPAARAMSIWVGRAQLMEVT